MSRLKRKGYKLGQRKHAPSNTKRNAHWRKITEDLSNFFKGCLSGDDITRRMLSPEPIEEPVPTTNRYAGRHHGVIPIPVASYSLFAAICSQRKK